MAFEPDSDSSEFSLRDGDIRYVCHSCCQLNPPAAHFCPHCSVPLGDTAAIDPIKRIYAQGEMFRGIANRKHPEKWIIAGTLLITSQWLLAPTHFLDAIPPSSIDEILTVSTGSLPALYALTLLYRLAKNSLNPDNNQQAR